MMYFRLNKTGIFYNLVDHDLNNIVFTNLLKYYTYFLVLYIYDINYFKYTVSICNKYIHISTSKKNVHFCSLEHNSCSLCSLFMKKKLSPPCNKHLY